MANNNMLIICSSPFTASYQYTIFRCSRIPQEYGCGAVHESGFQLCSYTLTSHQMGQIRQNVRQWYVQNDTSNVYYVSLTYQIYPGLLETDETTQITESVLTIGNVTSADEGKVWCVAIYDQGSHKSEKAVLTVVGMLLIPLLGVLKSEI